MPIKFGYFNLFQKMVDLSLALPSTHDSAKTTKSQYLHSDRWKINFTILLVYSFVCFFVEDMWESYKVQVRVNGNIG